MTRTHAFVLWIACLLSLPILCVMQLLQALFGSVKRSVNMAIGIDQTANALFGGDPDETISSRIHRKALMGGGLWLFIERVINWLFGDPNHCKTSFENEHAATVDKD